MKKLLVFSALAFLTGLASATPLSIQKSQEFFKNNGCQKFGGNTTGGAGENCLSNTVDSIALIPGLAIYSSKDIQSKERAIELVKKIYPQAEVQTNKTATGFSIPINQSLN